MISKEKIVNLIIRDENNCIIDIKRIKYQKDKYNDLISINNYLELEKKEKCVYFNSDFDIECKKLFISTLAQNKGYLDLEVDFIELTFEKYYNVTKSNQLTINCVLEYGGIGNLEIFNFFLFLKDIIACFITVFIIFVVFLFHLQ